MKKLFKMILALTLAMTLVLTLLSCRSAGNMSNEDYSVNGSESYNGGYGPDYGKSEDKNGSDDLDSSLLEDRKIIKTVNQSLQTEDFNAVIENINALTSELGGYISDSNFYGESFYNKNSLRSASLTVKIPAAKLSDFTSRVEKGAVVTRYNESANDVTGAYIDVESKIAVYEAEEAALLEMLKESLDITTMLAVRKSLNEVQYNLASLRAQKNSYDSRIEYSTVYLSIEEVRQVTSKHPTFFEEIGNEFSSSLYGIGSFFRNLAVWLVGDILYILLYGAVITGTVLLFLVIKKRKTDKERRDEAKEKNEEQ